MQIPTKSLIPGICAALAGGLLAARAAVTNVPVVADTFINSGALYISNNAGANLWLDVGSDGNGGVRRGLLRFDLSKIPAGSTITSAVMQLTVTKLPPSAAGDVSLDLFRLQADWGEGNKGGNNGALAGSGEATWNARKFGVSDWTSPGARNDSAGSASATTPVGTNLYQVHSWSSAGMVADAQLWLEHPEQNFGWLLVSQAEDVLRSVRAFGTRESTNAPTLQIGYSPPASNAPPTIFLANPTNGATFAAPASVTFDASATDSDGNVALVEFFDGTTLLGSDTNSPARLTRELGVGAHTLTAVATDNQGAKGTSAVVTITVQTVPITNPIPERIAKGEVTIELKPIADGMSAPLGMAVPDDGSGRMFIYDQAGVVWVVMPAGRLPTPALDLRTRLVNIGGNAEERGLLGLAAHPNFAQNPLLYTYTSERSNAVADFSTTLPLGVTNNHQAVIAEWRINPASTNQIDAATRREILRIDQPQADHNGGTLRFGSDGLLYVAVGDGGGLDDEANGHSSGGNGQDTNNVLGKVLRIDAGGTNSANGQYGVPADNPFVGQAGVPEIYTYGLRSPRNFSFDATTGQLYLGDTGQDKLEEIDVIQKGGNYGWPIKEGSFYFDANGSGTGYVTTVAVRPVPPNLVEPAAQYDHDDGGAVVGGSVYRGSQLAGLTGRYVFGDLGTPGSPSGRLYYLDADAIKELRIGLADRPLGLYVKGFGQDAAGELYVFGSKSSEPSGASGVMYKLVSPPASTLAAASAAAVVNGANFKTTWSGGMGPFVQQRKTVLDEPAWANELFVTSNSAATPVRGGSGFFRQFDTAGLDAVPFSAILSSSNVANPTASSGTGFGLFRLAGNSLTFTITYRGLTGPATLAHFHGPAGATNSTGVLIDLRPYHNGIYASTGSFSGTIVLTDTQKALVLAGLTYVNIHTASSPGGEIRGQVAPMLMQISLLAAPAPGGARGFGSAILLGDQLTFNIAYRGLTGPANAAHIHGRAGIGGNAGVLIDLSSYSIGGFGDRGQLSGTVTLTPAQLAAVIDGQTYVNFHTDAHQSGELRGQILAQSTATPYTAWLSGLNEKPTALTNTAAGLGIFSLEGNTLSFAITYSGLSGPATRAHIHGATNTAGATGIQIDFEKFNNGGFGSSGAFAGAVTLTPAQRAMVVGGLSYFNIHTAANPGGEMRGQIASVLMLASASGAAERQNPTVTSGSALGLFALVSNQLRFNIVYRDLSGPASDAHIHAAATTSQTAGVALGFTPFGGPFSSFGGFTGAANVAPTLLNNVIDGLSYINFHTAAYGSGEIRGQIGR